MMIGPLIYDRINRRVDSMLEEGLLDEARWLYDHYPDVQASKGIGYKELFPYFKGSKALKKPVRPSSATPGVLPNGS